MNANPLQAINDQYKAAYENAKDYIMNTNGWSRATFYRKMKQRKPLTETETDTIAQAYKIFIHEPLSSIVSIQIFS